MNANCVSNSSEHLVEQRYVALRDSEAFQDARQIPFSYCLAIDLNSSHFLMARKCFSSFLNITIIILYFS